MGFPIALYRFKNSLLMNEEQLWSPSYQVLAHSLSQEHFFPSPMSSVPCWLSLGVLKIRVPSHCDSDTLCTFLPACPSWVTIDRFLTFFPLSLPPPIAYLMLHTVQYAMLVCGNAKLKHLK